MVDTSKYGTKKAPGTAVVTKKDGSKIYLKDSKVVKEKTPSGKTRVRIAVKSPGSGRKKSSSSPSAVKVDTLKKISVQDKVLDQRQATKRWTDKVEKALQDVARGKVKISDRQRKTLIRSGLLSKKPSAQKKIPQPKLLQLNTLVPSRVYDPTQTMPSSLVVNELFENLKTQKKLSSLVESKAIDPQLRRRIGLTKKEYTEMISGVRKLADIASNKDPIIKFQKELQEKSKKIQKGTSNVQEIADFIKDKLLIDALKGKKYPAVLNEIAVELGVGVPASFVQLATLGVGSGDIAVSYAKAIFSDNNALKQRALKTLDANTKKFGRNIPKFLGESVKSFNVKTPEGVANILFLIGTLGVGGVRNIGRSINKSLKTFPRSISKVVSKNLRRLSTSISKSNTKKLINDFRLRGILTKVVKDPVTRRKFLKVKTPSKKITIKTKRGITTVRGFNTKTIPLTPKSFATLESSIIKTFNKFPKIRIFYTPELRRVILTIENRQGYLLRSFSARSSKDFAKTASQALNKELKRLNANLLKLQRKTGVKKLKDFVNKSFKKLESKISNIYDSFLLDKRILKSDFFVTKKALRKELSDLGIRVSSIKTDFLKKFPKVNTVYDKELGKLSKFITDSNGKVRASITVRTLNSLKKQYSSLIVRELNRLNSIIKKISSKTGITAVAKKIRNFFTIVKNKTKVLFDDIRDFSKFKADKISKSVSKKVSDLGLKGKDLATFKKLREGVKKRILTVYDKNLGSVHIAYLDRNGLVKKYFGVKTFNGLKKNLDSIIKKRLYNILRKVKTFNTESKKINYLRQSFKKLNTDVKNYYGRYLNRLDKRKLQSLLKKDVVEVDFKGFRQATQRISNAEKSRRQLLSTLSRITKNRLPKAPRTLTNAQRRYYAKQVAREERLIKDLIDNGVIKNRNDLNNLLTVVNKKTLTKTDISGLFAIETKPTFITKIPRQIQLKASDLIKNRKSELANARKLSTALKNKKAPRTLTKAQRKNIKTDSRVVRDLQKLGIKKIQSENVFLDAKANNLLKEAVKYNDIELAELIKPLVTKSVPINANNAKKLNEFVLSIQKIDVKLSTIAKNSYKPIFTKSGKLAKAPRTLSKAQRKAIRDDLKNFKRLGVSIENEIVKNNFPKNVVVKKGNVVAWGKTKKGTNIYRVKDVLKKPSSYKKDGIEITSANGQITTIAPQETVRKAVKQEVRSNIKKAKTKSQASEAFPKAVAQVYSEYKPPRKNFALSPIALIRELRRFYTVLERSVSNPALLNNPAVTRLSQAYSNTYKIGSLPSSKTKKINSQAQFSKLFSDVKKATDVAIDKAYKTTTKTANKAKIKQSQRKAVQSLRQQSLQRLLTRLRTILRNAKRRLPTKIKNILLKKKLSSKDKEELKEFVKSVAKKYRPSLASVIYGFTSYKIPKSVIITPISSRPVVSRRK